MPDVSGETPEVPSPSGGERYAAFISYSHRDRAIAKWLHRAIEAYRMPRDLVGRAGDSGSDGGDARGVPARLRPVFRDEDELGGAAELGPRLEQALAASRALIVVCSPAAAQSAWVDKEIRTFKRLRPGAPVLGMIASGTPDESFPPALRFAVDAVGRIDPARPIEPLAPDLAKLGRRAVKLKLVAGLSGVPYADLERRDLRRRRAVTAALGSAALIIIAVLSVLTVIAVSYARLAMRERNAAEAARAIAVRERNQAIAARELAEKRTWLAQQAASQIRAFAQDSQCPPPRDRR